MAATFVSAGVYIQEKDDSLYAPALAPTIIGIVGTATRGPENTATLITNEGQLIDTFGEPRTKDFGMQVAIQALKQARLVYFVRIAGAAGTVGTISIDDAGSAATTASIGPSANGETFNLLLGSVESPAHTRTNLIRFNFNNGSPVTDKDAEFIGVQADVDAGNAGTFDLDNIAASAATTLTLKIDGGIVQTITFDAADPIVIANGGYAALTAAGAAAVINSQIIGGEAGYVTTQLTVYSDRFGSGSIVEITGGTANDAVDGFDFPLAAETGASGSNVSDLSAVTGAEVKTVIEADADTSGLLVDVALDGAVTIHTTITGASSAIEIESVLSTAVGASPLINLTPLDSTVNGSNAAAAAATVRFDASTKGSHSGNIKVRITASTALSGTIKLEVLYKDVVVETYDKLLKSTAATPITGSYALETAINSGIAGVFDASEYIDATSLSASGENPVPGTYTLTAGLNGDDWTSGTVIGTVSGTVRTGMQLFADPEQIYVNVLATPGISYSAVIAEGLSICESRADCIFVVDCPIGLSPTEVDDWSKGGGATVTVDQELRTEANATTFDNSFGACYYPFVQVFDKYNPTSGTDGDGKIFIPPSALVLATYAFTDESEDPWFAPAGPNRTRKTPFLDLEYSPSLGERDLLQLPGNNINPIANLSSIGITIMGQKTLQRAPTSLDRVNVRRLLLQAQKLVASAAIFLTFEPNDSIMWRRFINLVSPIFDDIQSRRGLYDFRVVADSSTTTDTLINQSTFLGKIFLQPTKAAEKIVVGFNIVPTGANFDEFAQA